MKIENKENFLVIISDEETFAEFMTSFLSKKEAFQKNHLIVVLSDSLQLTNHHLSEFIDISNNCKKNGKSFVVVNSIMNADDVPENLNVIPTLQEAADIIEMEDIERELGF